MTALYTANATATGGRNGTAKTDDGKINVTLSPPGGNGTGTNPEQLFATGYAACFGGAVAFAAKQQGLEVGDVTINSHVTLNKDDATGFSLTVAMDVSLPNLDQTTAEKVVTAGHGICPYSKAIKGNVTVTTTVNGQQLANAA